MGRYSTGAITVNSCLNISVSSLAKIIKKGNFYIPHSISWQSGASITVTIRETKSGYYLDLQYEKKENGEKIPIKYTVWIVGKPSNLGKGTIYYFLCPVTYKRCRFLYMGYGSRYFKSREAYQHRIYYPSQLSSRLEYHNDKYWNLEGKLEKLCPKHPNSH